MQKRLQVHITLDRSRFLQASITGIFALAYLREAFACDI